MDPLVGLFVGCRVGLAVVSMIGFAVGDKVGIPGALVTAFVGTTDGASVGSVKGVVGRFPKSGSKLVGADEGIGLGIDDCGGITGMAVG